MKHTKYLILPLFLFSVLISSCNKEDLIVENESSLDAGKKSSKANSFYEEGLPKIKFIPNKKQKNTYSIRITDPNQTTPVNIVLKLRSRGQELNARAKESDDNKKMVVFVNDIEFETAIEEEILDIYLEYLEGDVIVKSFEYSLFVFADGTTALQKPEVKSINWTWVDGGITVDDDWEVRASVAVDNDPANVVESVLLQFNEPFNGPKPMNQEYKLELNKDRKRYANTRGIIFNDDPNGLLFDLTFTMLDAKGEKISAPQNVNTIVLLRGIDISAIRRGMVKEVVSSGSGKITGYKVVIIVKGDDNDDVANVAAVKVQFNEPFTGTKPNISELMLVNSKENPQRFTVTCDLSVENGICLFDGKESVVGQTYNITASMVDIKGNIIGEPQTFDITVEGNTDEPTSVKSLQITETFDENGFPEHDITAVLSNINLKKYGYMEVKFNEPFTGPKPTQNFRLKNNKHPDLVKFTEYEEIALTYRAVVNPNPDGTGTEISPLFDRSAAGYTYNVTTTIFDINDKPIGQPQTFNVTIEGETDVPDPVLISTRFYSADGGKTWNYEAVIEDNGQWVEKVQLEFVKPFEGPAPVYNPIGLSLVKKDGNIKLYSGKVEYTMGADPTGFFYTAIIQQFGSGTRRAAGQANNKAELL